MSVFTPAEIEYLKSQRLGRIATVDASGMPHVVPARYLYNEELDCFDIVGRGMGTSKKFRDAARTGKAALVVDDAPEPRKIRGIEIRGHAEAITTGGEHMLPGTDPEFIRLLPGHVASWGIDTGPYDPAASRDVNRE